jgi:hypothetical protein
VNQAGNLALVASIDAVRWAATNRFMTPYTRWHAERDAEMLASLDFNNYDLAEEVLDLKTREASQISNNGLSAQLIALYEGIAVERVTTLLADLLHRYGVEEQLVRGLLAGTSE